MDEPSVDDQITMLVHSVDVKMEAIKSTVRQIAEIIAARKKLEDERAVQEGADK